MSYTTSLCQSDGILIRGPSHNLEVIVRHPRSNRGHTKVDVLGSSLMQPGMYCISEEQSLKIEPDLVMRLHYRSKYRIVIGFQNLPKHYRVENFTISLQTAPRT